MVDVVLQVEAMMPGVDDAGVPVRVFQVAPIVLPVEQARALLERLDENFSITIGLEHTTN